MRTLLAIIAIAFHTFVHADETPLKSCEESLEAAYNSNSVGFLETVIEKCNGEIRVLCDAYTHANGLQPNTVDERLIHADCRLHATHQGLVKLKATIKAKMKLK